MAGSGTERRVDTDTLEKVREDLKKPDMYKVVLHNDDYTTKLFVVEVLQVVFHKPMAEATRIMLHIHRNGRGVVGVYTWDIARTKVAQVAQLARDKEFPLKCTIEQE